jgi:acyl-CoA synthetase (AMP-forming)/AMP-acid ligase II
VELTHAGILTHCQAWTERFGFKEGGTVQLNVLPTFHVSGMVYGIWMPCISGTVVYHPQFEPANYLAAIERHRVTDAFAVPAMLRALIEAPELRRTDFSSLRCIAYGGSPIDPGLLRRCMQALPCAFRQVYGMTESSGTIALLQPEDHDPDGPRAHLLQSIGKPGAHFGLRIVDPVSGRECPDGAVGELWVRSAQNLAGYFQDPDATAALFPEGRAAGWYRTGDAGYRREGYLFLHDRIKDMIITGGENVYPTEIEHVLAAHPAIMEVAVIGVPDEKWGETVKACVVVRSGRSVSPPEVIAYARERLARYKCPTSVDFLDALPRNPTGKVLKATLREPYWAGRKRNIA